METVPGSGVFREIENPVSTAAVLEAAEDLDLCEHAVASLTGGEPLLQPEAVAELAQAVRARGPRVLLETHGLAVSALESLVSHLDIVSMDWKLRSDVRREGEARRDSGEDFHDQHEAFLSVARRAPEVVVKVVVTPNTKDAELDEVCRRVARTAPAAPLILQPVTPTGSVKHAPAPEQLLVWLQRASRFHTDVRLIPQVHRALGLL